MCAEGERYRVDDLVGNRGGVNVLSVSLVFPIGRGTEPTRRVAAAPAYTPAPALMPAPVEVARAAPPVPMPAPVPPAAEPQRMRVTFNAEFLFGFDRSTLQPAGRTALDGFAAQTRGTRFDIVTVEGASDRLGPPGTTRRCRCAAHRR